MTNKTKLAQRLLMELMNYNKYTGIFTWRERGVHLFSHCKYPERACATWNANFNDKVCGSIFTSKKSGRVGNKYIIVAITIRGVQKNYLAHRLAFIFITGHFPKCDPDHIDHNGLNNKWENLRDTSENHKNKSIAKNNKSGFTGVHYNASRNRWIASIKVDSKYIYGGTFEDINDAIECRNRLNIKYGFHKNHGKQKIGE